MNQTSLTRRLFAGAASLMIGAAGAFAFAAPASAQGEEAEPYGAPASFKKNVEVVGVAECDIEAEAWTVTWTVANTSSFLDATVTSLSSEEVDGIAVDDLIEKGGSATGTQTFPNGTESAELTVELKWAWQIWGHWKVVTKAGTGVVELTDDCKGEEPPPEEPPEEPPAEPVLPVGIAFFDCDLLGFILDNSAGDGEAVFTLTPNEPANHGHASGFSYTVDDEGTIEIIADEGAGITEELGEADSDNPVVLGPFAAGADAHTHAFEASEGLVVTVELTLDGEPVELEDNEISWDAGIEEAGLECEDDGAGGELPTTGSSTMLIAGGALALLAVGGGLFVVARRRRVTFTA